MHVLGIEGLVVMGIQAGTFAGDRVCWSQKPGGLRIIYNLSDLASDVFGDALI